MGAAAQGLRFIVYTRDECPMCDEFIAELAPQFERSGLSFEVHDVDDDPKTRRRFGLSVPVLTVDGSPVCHGRVDAAAVARLLAH